MQIEFTTDLGAKVFVDVDHPDQLLAVQRQYGHLGWTCGAVPLGGYVFPYDNFEDFDWRLIGARKWRSPEGEDLIIHRGQAYRIRRLEAVDSRKMKLPAAIKISRGVKPTDPVSRREQAEGDFAYVTLCIFRGGRRQERLAVPGPRAAQPRSNTPGRAA